MVTLVNSKANQNEAAPNQNQVRSTSSAKTQVALNSNVHLIVLVAQVVLAVIARSPFCLSVTIVLTNAF